MISASLIARFHYTGIMMATCFVLVAYADNQDYSSSGGGWEKTGNSSYEHKGATFSGFRYSTENNATNTYKYEVGPPSGWSFVPSKTNYSGGTKIADPTASYAGIKKINSATTDPVSFVLSMGGELTTPGSGSGTVTWSASATTDFYYVLPNIKIVALGDSTSFTAKENSSALSSNWTCSPTWTGYAALNGKASISVGNGGDWSPPEGSYTVTAAKTNSDRSASATLKIVKITAITVESGATQTNVTGSDNWATVKDTSQTPGDVVIKITLIPAISTNELPANFISWSGGTAVQGDQLRRKVSKGTSAKTIVTATCGNSSKTLNVWVLWSTLSIQVSGSKPSAASSLTFPFSNPTCGVVTDTVNGNLTGWGNMCGTATITPAGIDNVISSGWDIKRDRMSRLKVDGIKSENWDSTWKDDDAHNTDEILTPKDNKIYVIDAPNIGAFGDNSATVSTNFQEWVRWNGSDCSDKKDWHHKGTWTNGTPQTITDHEINTGHMTLPTD